MKEHFDEVRVKRRWVNGYCSGASASDKLLGIDDRNRLPVPGVSVVAASWSRVQVIMVRAGNHGQVITTDTLEMVTIADVPFIQGDFTEERMLHAMLEALGNRPINEVLSDMIFNVSGQMTIDQPKPCIL